MIGKTNRMLQKFSDFQIIVGPVPSVLLKTSFFFYVKGNDPDQIGIIEYTFIFPSLWEWLYL